MSCSKIHKTTKIYQAELLFSNLEPYITDIQNNEQQNQGEMPRKKWKKLTMLNVVGSVR